MFNFGNNLNKIRKSMGLSQEELATKLGTSKQVISRYENGQRIPKITVAHEYAAILGCPISALVGKSSEPYNLPSSVKPIS